jgi:hypothetical protein
MIRVYEVEVIRLLAEGKELRKLLLTSGFETLWKQWNCAHGTT